MRIDHSASTIAAPHFAGSGDLSSGGVIVCEPGCEPPPGADVSRWEAETSWDDGRTPAWEGEAPAEPWRVPANDPIMADDEEEASEVDDFDEDDFDDEFDDDFEEELEDEYDLADLEEVSDEDLAEDDADLPIGGDFVDEDEEPEEPALPEDPEAPAEEEEKPKKGKGKAPKGKKKSKDDDDDLDLDDDE